MMVLHHGGPCGHSAAVLIALAEKGLEVEWRRVDLARFGQAELDFLALNPAGQVPVLEANGRVLTESFFIMLWLDETYPEPSLGGDAPRARYEVHKWGKYIETHIAPNLAIWRWTKLGVEAPGALLLSRLPLERRALWERAAKGLSAEELERAGAALEKAAERLAADIQHGGWLVGDSYTLADIAAYPHIAQFQDLGIAVPEMVGDWLARIAMRPAVREVADEMPLVATMGPELCRWG